MKGYPGRRLKKQDLRDFLAIAYMELRNSDFSSVLGWVWHLLNPLIMLLVTYTVFSSRLATGSSHYAAHVLSGIILLNAFSTLSTAGMLAFIKHRDLIMNSTIRPEVVLGAELARHYLKFAIELLLFSLLGVCLGVLQATGPFFVLLAGALFAPFCLGTAFLLTFFYALAGDFQYIWAYFNRLLFFATPVFYRLHDLSGAPRAVVECFNPLTFYLELIRTGMAEGSGSLVLRMAGAGAFSALVFASGLALFLKRQDLIKEML